jgi:hypothetical protein
MQTAINPALAAAMTLDKAAQFGEFQPTTKDGQPTVAAQLMQKAVAPAVNEIAQQVGLGGQIQAMQMQEAQKALMQQAMAQRPPAGIEGLNPQMGNYADGGIVGYSGQDGSVAEEPWWKRLMRERSGMESSPDQRRGYERVLDALSRMAPSGSRLSDVLKDRRIVEDTEKEAARFEQDVPYGSVNAPVALPPAPPAPPEGGIVQTLPAAQRAPAVRPTEGLASSSQKDLAAMQTIAQELSKLPILPSAEGNVQHALEKKNAADQYARATGNDPDMVLKQISQYEDMYRRQDEKLARRAAQLESEKGLGGIKEFLLGARGIKGQGGIGAELASGARSAMAYDEGVRNRLEKIEDLRMDLESVKAERVNSLRKFKYETDMGHYQNAEKERMAVVDANRKQKLLELEIAKTRAEINSAEARVRAQVESSAADRATMRQTGIDQKMAELLRANNAEYNRAVDQIKDRWAKTDPATMAYNAMQLGKQAVTPEAQRAYLESQRRMQQEIDAQTSDIRKEIDRLQTMIYGPGAVKKAPTQSSAAPMYASNPKTGQRIMSTDGGKTWQPA